MNTVYKKLEAVRKPRVHITYDVETEGSSIKKELPFVVGVIGDYSGNAKKNKKPLKNRKFVQIDADNFNEVMSKIGPEIDIKVKNTLANDDSELGLNLHFNNIEDFEPAKIIQQVEPLKKLMATRTQLNELLSKADLSSDLEALLENILQSDDALKQLTTDLGIEKTEEQAQ